jgi:hypothetical protein
MNENNFEEENIVHDIRKLIFVKGYLMVGNHQICLFLLQL